MMALFEIEISPWSPGRVCCCCIVIVATLFLMCGGKPNDERWKQYTIKKERKSFLIKVHVLLLAKHIKTYKYSLRPPRSPSPAFVRHHFQHINIQVDKANTQIFGGDVVVSAGWITDAIDLYTLLRFEKNLFSCLVPFGVFPESESGCLM